MFITLIPIYNFRHAYRKRNKSLYQVLDEKSSSHQSKSFFAAKTKYPMELRGYVDFYSTLE
jgi:hypothetical protein